MLCECAVRVISEFERVDPLSGWIGLPSIPVCPQGRPGTFFYSQCIVPLHTTGTLWWPRVLIWKLASCASLGKEPHLMGSWSFTLTQEFQKEGLCFRSKYYLPQKGMAESQTSNRRLVSPPPPRWRAGPSALGPRGGEVTIAG